MCVSKPIILALQKLRQEDHSWAAWDIWRDPVSKKQKARLNLHGRVRTSDGEEGMQTRPLDPSPMSTLV